jgi:putative membrane protein
MMWNAGDGMGWWMLLGSVWFVIFWAVVIWAVVRVTASGRDAGEASAIEIARRRYARGEIDREEFEKLRRDLAV